MLRSLPGVLPDIDGGMHGLVVPASCEPLDTLVGAQVGEATIASTAWDMFWDASVALIPLSANSSDPSTA